MFSWLTKPKVSKPPHIDKMRGQQLRVEAKYQHVHTVESLQDAIVKTNTKLASYAQHMYTPTGSTSFYVYDPDFAFQYAEYIEYYESHGYTVKFEDCWPATDKSDAGHFVQFIISWPFKGEADD